MSGELIGSLILWLITAIVVIAIAVWLLNWLYHRSTKEMSFVRTGLGGEKVVINGGALVLPIIHEVTPVNMNVVRMAVARRNEGALITVDRMRMDIEAEFFIRVKADASSVGAAAATLGRRMMEPDNLSALFTGKFVSALRAVAAEMPLDALHEKRSDYIDQVSAGVAASLAQNGLELESVAIVNLDQTELEHFNPANQFDSEGLTKLIQTIEERRQTRNDIEQRSIVAIRSRNLDAEKETLALERESISAQLDQQRDIEERRSAQRADIERTQAEREAEAAIARIESEVATNERDIARRKTLEASEIEARELLEQRRIAQELAVEAARIERDKAIRAGKIAERQLSESAEIEAQKEVETARVLSEQAVRASKIAAEEENDTREIARTKSVDAAQIASRQEVDTARITYERQLDKVRVERDRALKSLQIGERQATEEAEISALEEIERARIASDRSLEEARIIRDRDMKILATERARAIELAEIEKTINILNKKGEEQAAQIETDRERARAVSASEAINTAREKEIADRITAIDLQLAQKNADAEKIAAEAAQIRAAVTSEAERLKNEAENILTDEARSGRLRAQLLDRLEGIVRESVKPVENIEGIKILHVDGLAGGSGGTRSPTDEVIESALRYRAQAPLIDELMKEIGIEGAGVAKMGDIFRSARDAQAIAKESGGNSGKGS